MVLGYLDLTIKCDCIYATYLALNVLPNLNLVYYVSFLNTEIYLFHIQNLHMNLESTYINNQMMNRMINEGLFFIFFCISYKNIT